MDNDQLQHLTGWFNDYCRSYYTSDEADNRNIILKEEHTRQVCANMDILTAALGFTESRRNLARALALLHDLGRFEQYRRYRTFKDSASENHAAIGAGVLAENRLLAGLPIGDQQLVTRGVALHNVFRMPSGLDPDTLLFLRLIRDADKLDIWRVFIEYYTAEESERASAVSLGLPDVPGISPEVLAALDWGEMVNLALITTLSDFKLLQLSWVYDINFAAALRVIAERDYVGRIAALLSPDPAVAGCVDKVRTYLGNYLKRQGENPCASRD